MNKILTYTVNGKDLPVFLKRNLEDQIPSLKLKKLDNAAFATKSIQDLFSPETLQRAIVKQFNYPSSIVAINQGDGEFLIKKLPRMAQLSSVNSILPIDLDNTKKTDLVLGGNLYTFLPQFERLDASFGDVLINDGKGNFKWVKQKLTGLNVNGMVRDIVKIKVKNGYNVLFLVNDKRPVMYELQKINKAALNPVN
jgi:hypothetical protein